MRQHSPEKLYGASGDLLDKRFLLHPWEAPPNVEKKLVNVAPAFMPSCELMGSGRTRRIHKKFRNGMGSQVLQGRPAGHSDLQDTNNKLRCT